MSLPRSREVVLAPLEHHRLTDLAVHALRRAILHRQFRPGEQLNFPSLARQLGVSLTPLGEAARILADQGVLEIKPRQGTYVRPITRESLISTKEARLLVETWAIENFVDRAGTDDWEALERYLSEARALVQSPRIARSDAGIDKWTDLDSGFHRRLVSACRNERLLRFYDSLGTLLSFTRVVMDRTFGSRMSESHDDHFAVYQHLKNGDSAAAVARLKQHVERSFEKALERIEAQGGVV